MKQVKVGHSDLQRAAVRAFAPRHLELAIAPTEACNFRCTYCFEQFDHGRMSPATVDALRQLLAKRIPGLNALVLHWYGGEPLLAAELVLSISCFAQAQCLEHGVEFRPSTMSTNGWRLDSATLAALIDVGVSTFQITLDGEQTVHDQTRRLANGRGTFERVYSNLLAAKASEGEFQIVLRLHLHADNVESQSRLARRLHDDFSSDGRFRVHPVTVGDYGGSSISGLRLATAQDGRDACARIRGLWGGVVFDVPRDGGPFVCYAAQQNHFFIRADGRVAKCTSAPDLPANHVGHLRSDGELEIDWPASLRWSAGFKSGRAGELACPLRALPDLERVAAPEHGGSTR